MVQNAFSISEVSDSIEKCSNRIRVDDTHYFVRLPPVPTNSWLVLRSVIRLE